MVSPNNDFDVIRALGASNVFGALPAQALERLAGAARIERYQRPSLLNAANQPLEWLRLVLEGHIEILARSPSGGETALADIGPGGWVTWVACFSSKPPDHDFYSSANAILLALPVSLVRAVVHQHPDVYVRVIESIGVRMRLLMEWTGQSVMLAPEQRMAKLLHVLARVRGAVDGNRAVLPITQAQLARLARCSRQSANLLLRALERRALIRSAYGRYEIDDMTALDAFTERDDQGLG